MAKKDPDKNVPAAKSKKVKKKKGGPLVPILIIFILILGATAVIVFDLFGVRTKYLTNLLSNVPIIGSMFAPSEIPEEYIEKTPGEYQVEIENLKTRLASIESSLASEQEKSKMYVKEIERLSEIEAVQERYKEDKALFDRMIAENDSSAYIQFYERISPENQWGLYKESVVNQQKTAEMNSYIKTIESMDGTAAAKMLEQLISTNMDLVVMVLKNTKADIRGEILSSMSVENAASVYKFMAPEQ